MATQNGRKVVYVDIKGEKRRIETDELLIAVGREVNVEGLDLEKAGVQYTSRAVTVNDALQTTNPHIYAAGDVCMKYKFTHMADAAARIVIQNAMFGLFKKKLSSLIVPWCTYTDPQIAHVGLYEPDAPQQKIELDSFERSLAEVDRAIIDNEKEGFVKIYVKKGTDRIVGATVVARHAGEMISEITTAMVGKVGLKTLASVIHPYPTEAEAIKQIADAYNRTRLTPGMKRIFKYWFTWLAG